MPNWKKVITSGSDASLSSLSLSNLGSQNEILLVGANNQVSSSDLLSIDTTNNRVGIGTSSPEVKLHIDGDAAQEAQIRLEQHNDTADAPDIRIRRSRGTHASPAVLASGDYGFRLNVDLYDGSDYTNAGQLRWDNDGTNNNNGTNTVFGLQTRVSGTTADRLTIDKNGNATFSGAVDVTSALTASGLNYPSSDGTDGQVLITDGSGALTFSDNISYVTVKNVSGGTLPKGTPVHATGTSGNTPEVIASSASLASSMPANFVLAENITTGTEGRAILSGFLNGVNTTGLTEGDNIYVAPTGNYTTTKPQGAGNLIQNIAIVGSVGANGSIYVYGSGRSNDIPNLPVGKIWVGSSDYSVTSSFVHLDEVNSAVQISGSLVISQSNNGQAIDIINTGSRWRQYIDSSGNITLNASGSATNNNVNYTLEKGNFQVNLKEGHFNLDIDNTGKDFRIRDSSNNTYFVVTGDKKVGIGANVGISPDQDVEIEGTVRIRDYGTGNKTGTLAYTLGVDSNGDIIETTGGSTSPGGSDGQIQYNNGGTFGGESTFTYDDANNTLTVEGATNQPSITLSNAQSVTIANGSQLSEIQTHYASNEVGTVAFVAEGAFNVGDTPTRIELRTTNDGTGSPTTKFQIKNDGKLIADTYGSGTHTGTVAKYLAVDSSGNVIEEDTSTVAVYTPDVYEINDVSITSYPYFFEYSTTKVIDGSTNTAVNTAGDGITISNAGMYEAKYTVAMQTFDTTRKNPAIRAEYNSVIIKGSRGITYTRTTGTNNAPFGSIEVSFYFNVSAGAAGNDLQLKMTLLNGSGNLTVDGYHATSNTLSIRRIS
jgi:hypothetical protein